MTKITTKLQNTAQQLIGRVPPELVLFVAKGKLAYARLTKAARLVLFVTLALILNVLWLPFTTHATGASMLLFWDPANGSVPAGWCHVSAVDGYFPRGADTTTVFPTTVSAPGRPYSLATNTLTISAADTTASSGGGTGLSSAAHTHPNPTLAYDAESNGDVSNPNLPAFRSLQLIEYGTSAGGGLCTGAGIPNTIPQNAIAMFDTLPSGWTRITAQDNKMIMANNTVATGGGDTETTTIHIPALTAASQQVASNAFLLNTNAARNTHTHAAPTSLTCTSGCATPTTACASTGTDGSGRTTYNCVASGNGVLPPYVRPILASANSSTSTLSLNIISMFDGDPGNGWVVLSNAGGTFNNQFIRPASTSNFTSLGAASHGISFNGDYQAQTGPTTTTLALGATAAASTHIHNMAVTTTTVSNIPPYFGVIIAQKVNFTLSHYQWYVDNNVYTETDTWPTGTLGTAQDAQIPALPAQYQPPDISTQLRLRVQITVSGKPMSLNTISFKLQYSSSSNSTDCVTGNWLDVGNNSDTTRDWRYSLEPSPTMVDGTQVPTSLLSSVQRENFYESKSTGTGFTNPAAAATGDTIEYDWAIQNYAAAGGTQYNFRVVENQGVDDAGTYLSVYSTCPSATTRASTDQLLRHGEFFLTDPATTPTPQDPDQGFSWAD